MASIDFPASLPVALVGSVKEGRVPAYVDDPSQIGAPRRRKRQTRTRKTFSFTIRLTDAQKVALDDFIDDTSDGGTIEFNWTHPITAVVYEVRFAAIPEPEDVTKGIWDAQIQIEEI